MSGQWVFRYGVGSAAGIGADWHEPDKCQCLPDECRGRLRKGFPVGRRRSGVWIPFRIFLRGSGFRCVWKQCIWAMKACPVTGGLSSGYRCFPNRVGWWFCSCFSTDGFPLSVLRRFPGCFRWDTRDVPDICWNVPVLFPVCFLIFRIRRNQKGRRQGLRDRNRFPSGFPAGGLNPAVFFLA